MSTRFGLALPVNPTKCFHNTHSIPWLQIQQAELDKQSGAVLTERSVGGDLRREILRASNEQAMVDARLEETHVLHERLVAECGELRQELVYIAQGQQGADPEAVTIRNATAEVQQEIQQRKADIEQLAFQKADREKRLTEATQRKVEAEDEERQLQQQIVVCTAAPLRTAKQAAVVSTAVKTVENNLQRENALILKLVAEQQAMAAGCAQLRGQISQADQREAEAERMLEAGEQRLSHLQSELAAGREEQIQTAGDRTLHDAEVRRVFAEIKALKDRVAQEERTKEKGLRTLKQLEIRDKHTMEQLQVARDRKRELDTQAAAARREATDFASALPKAERDMEVAQKQWEASVGQGSEAVLAVHRAAAEVRELGVEVSKLQAEGRNLARSARLAQTNVDRAGSERLAAMSAHARQLDQVGATQLVIAGLRKSMAATEKARQVRRELLSDPACAPRACLCTCPGLADVRSLL